MPNLLSHTLLVKRFFLKEDRTPGFKSSFLYGNFDFFSLGAQGPDPLFYVGLLPKNGLHLITANKKIGNQIHKTDGKKYFKCLIERSYGIEDEKNSIRFQAFIFGQFAHYILDRETHPYILYTSGFGDDGRISGKYHYLHANFESNIDTCLAKKFKMAYFHQNPEDILCKDRDFLNIIDKEYVPALSNMFDTKLPKHMYTNAIDNMRSVVRFMNHNNGWKRKVLPKRILGPAMPEMDKLDWDDCLNEQKNKWLDPVTGQEHNDSFIDLDNRAFDILESCYHDILKNGFNYAVISKYLNGLNYYGTPIGSKFVYKK